MEFKSWGKIGKYGAVKMTITEKIHGTNASVCIYRENEDGPYMVRAGSRTRWIYPHDDNFGFAAWVEANKVDIINKLGPGTHYGEFAGPRINSGCGLNKRMFVLFHPGRYPLDESGQPDIPPDTAIVPVLYDGPYSHEKVLEVFEDLRQNGSKLVPGFMRPEGIVVNCLGQRHKLVFDAEETGWKKPESQKAPKAPLADFSHLCQPIRLDKLLSRDEKYIREYPKSMLMIHNDYTIDLIEENQITGSTEEIDSTVKASKSQLFDFIRAFIKEQNA